MIFDLHYSRGKVLMSLALQCLAEATRVTLEILLRASIEYLDRYTVEVWQDCY